MDISNLLRELRATHVTVGELRARPEPGVYVWFLAQGASLHPFSVPSDRLIYVGSSRNLAQRQFETHFSSRQTGFSTIRRTLGAILKQKLRLRARPRGRGTTPQEFYCYRFEPEGEERLTDWMHRYIEVAVTPVQDYGAAETDLIASEGPLLNLNSANPDAPAIKRLRKVCADEARSRHAR